MGLDHRSMPRPPQDPPPPQANPFSSTRICDTALLLQAQKQQLSLALAYFDHGDVDVDAGVRRGMIERLSDVEDGPKHQEPGLRH